MGMSDYIKPDPAYTYMIKVYNRNIRKKCEICSKLTVKTPERHHWPISHWTYFTPFSIVSIVDFESKILAGEVVVSEATFYYFHETPLRYSFYILYDILYIDVDIIDDSFYKYTDDQSSLQSDCTKAFQPATCEPKFSLICGFCRKLQNH